MESPSPLYPSTAPPADSQRFHYFSTPSDSGTDPLTDPSTEPIRRLRMSLANVREDEQTDASEFESKQSDREKENAINNDDTEDGRSSPIKSTDSSFLIGPTPTTVRRALRFRPSNNLNTSNLAVDQSSPMRTPRQRRKLNLESSLINSSPAASPADLSTSSITRQQRTSRRYSVPANTNTRTNSSRTPITPARLMR